MADRRFESLIAVADRGYYSGEEFAKCKADGIQPVAPKPDRGSQGQSEGYTKYHFQYDAEGDVYICPQGNELRPPKNPSGKRPEVRYSNSAACRNCTAKHLCVKGKMRIITRGEFDDFSDEVDAYTKANYDLYGQRKCLVEHPFGTVKSALGFTHFLTRGNENVRTESLLHFLAYNMKRLVNIAGKVSMKTLLQG